ncbi:MAG TPA: cyclic pyranopterin monophosphate synthase MoaC, partial [Abditibacteriaceae bacterium]|nr:cyclic pyranopterin monophosphate synthase MoaC [Abditibacteriaceae bacterium]
MTTEQAKSSRDDADRVLDLPSTADGRAFETQMIDVGGKAETTREAVACGTISMTSETLQMVRTSTLPKG